MPPSSPFRQLPLWGRASLVALALGVVAFSVAVEIRGAFLKTRMTDLGVFLRAAWAVRVGEDPYQVTDNKGLHYHYPPLFAIALTPLADPPPGASVPGQVPFAVSVALWYWLSVGFLALGVHKLATLLPAPMAVHWWGLRLVPVLVLLPAIGNTLSLGQVTLLLFFLLAGAIAAWANGRPFRAGLWLAGAICLKVIPAFLLLLPLWRRDGRTLAGCALGLVLGLAVIPAAALGPQRAWQHGQTWVENLLRPALHLGGDGQTRMAEVLEVTATHNQSVLRLLHFWQYPEFAGRPYRADPGTRVANYLIGGALTLLTLLAIGRRTLTVPALLLAVGCLCVNLLAVSPVGHPHYFAILIPLVMGLLVSPLPGRVLVALFAVYLAANALPLLPQQQWLFDRGLPLFGNLLLWAAGLWALRQRPAVAAAALARAA